MIGAGSWAARAPRWPRLRPWLCAWELVLTSARSDTVEVVMRAMRPRRWPCDLAGASAALGVGGLLNPPGPLRARTITFETRDHAAGEQARLRMQHREHHVVYEVH